MKEDVGLELPPLLREKKQKLYELLTSKLSKEEQSLVKDVENRSVIFLLETILQILEDDRIDPSYDTGRIKGYSNVYYIGTPGDSYMKGRNRVIGTFKGVIEAAKIENKL